MCKKQFCLMEVYRIGKSCCVDSNIIMLLYNKSLYIDLYNYLISICSIQHQMEVNLWTKPVTDSG